MTMSVFLINRNNNKTDEVRCIGDFDVHDAFCRKACALSLRCLITRNRNICREEFGDLFEFDDVEPAMMQ